MFRGVTAISLDAKGRLAVPTRYRDELASGCAGQLVITINTEERCLRLYPLPEWDIIQEKIESLPSFNSDARRIQFLLLGHATDVELDNSGRLVLPPLLRDYAQVEKKAVLIGRGKKFELWSDTLWEAQRARYLDEVADLTAVPDVLQSLVL